MTKHSSFFSQTIRLLMVLISVSALLITRPTQPAQADTLTVTNTNDSGAGSLRQAVTAASVGDTITFDASLAGNTITLAAPIGLNKNLTIDGSSLSSHIQISGGGSVRVFYVSSGVVVTLSHLDIINGYTALNGGGFVNGGTAMVSNSSFSGNRANYSGGAIINFGTGTLTITDSTFTGNEADSGGGIINLGSLTISNSTFTGNSTSGCGGAIDTRQESVLEISNSTFVSNDAQIGGAICSNNIGATATISSSTFSSNNASVSGGSIYNVATLHLMNSILADSPNGGDCENNGTLATNINNLIKDGSCAPAVTGDPNLGPLADNGGPTQTMALGTGSPAIDAGDDATCEPTDQRGVSRPQGAHCDIGAYEVELQLAVNSLDDPGDGTCDASECTLREAVALAESGWTIVFNKDLAGGVILLGAEIGIAKDLTIDGSGLDPNVQVSGDGSVRVFAVSGGATVTIDHLDLVDGSADDGGAINNNNGTLNVTDCTFYNNSAIDYGGAINNHQGMVSVASSTFYDNRSDQFGGGIFNNEGTVMVTNSTFYNNDALRFAGGIENYEGTLTISNSTFSANYVPTANQGGGILNSSNGTLHLKNTIIADSPTGGDCTNFGTLATNTNNLIEDGSCNPAVTGDPRLSPLADNGGPTQTMALGTGSPAIDAGDDATCEPTDQRGVSRPQGAHCDIGAYEVEPYVVYLPLIIR